MYFNYSQMLWGGCWAEAQWMKKKKPSRQRPARARAGSKNALRAQKWRSTQHHEGTGQDPGVGGRGGEAGPCRRVYVCVCVCVLYVYTSFNPILSAVGN